MVWPDQSRLRGGGRWGRRTDPGPPVLLAYPLRSGPGWWECGVPSLSEQWGLLSTARFHKEAPGDEQSDQG